jgi:hypothetical protein
MSELTAQHLRRILGYNPGTGIFTWHASSNRRIRKGQIAGCLSSSDGYWKIGVDGRSYLAHRLAWLHVYGHWPEHQIDHIDGNRANNRIENLRVATHSQNMHNSGSRRNNTSGLKGVDWYEPTHKWRARIWVDGKQLYLGHFDDKESAYAARNEAAIALHGAFARSA